MQFPHRRRSEIFKKRDDGPIPITEEGLRRLKERLEEVKKSLPHLIEETAKAAAYGDRSENFEYKDAKASLRRANGQILNIEDQIKRAVIIKIGANKSGKIQLGSTVVLELNGREKIFQILGPYETDPAKGRISHESPLGAALMNHKKGDTVTIQTASGSQEYRILEVK